MAVRQGFDPITRGRGEPAGAEGESGVTESASTGTNEAKGRMSGGEAGIRTLGRVLKPYNGLANRRLQPLGHLTVRGFPKDSADWLCRNRLLKGQCAHQCAQDDEKRPAGLHR